MSKAPEKLTITFPCCSQVFYKQDANISPPKEIVNSVLCYLNEAFDRCQKIKVPLADDFMGVMHNILQYLDYSQYSENIKGPERFAAMVQNLRKAGVKVSDNIEGLSVIHKKTADDRLKTLGYNIEWYDPKTCLIIDDDSVKENEEAIAAATPKSAVETEIKFECSKYFTHDCPKDPSQCKCQVPRTMSAALDYLLEINAIKR